MILRTKFWYAACLTLTAWSAFGAEPAKAPGAAIDVAAVDRERVLAAADRYVNDAPDPITAHPVPEELRPPEWTVHDFLSEADYDWPNPKNPGGPYIYRDGMSNPDTFRGHRHAMWKFDIEVPALTSAYLLTHNAKYVRPVLAHLHAWFVDPATRMNPSLPFAQGVRGAATGSPYGLIDTLHLVEVARSIVVLRRERQIDVSDEAIITMWFGDYLRWLTTSVPGIKEGNAHNNHAAAYWVQIAAFAQVTRDDALLAEARKRFKTQLLEQMSAADGSFPQELARTKPYGYSLFMLDQMVTLCQIASTPEDNLFEFTLPDGRCIAKGLAYMYPFVANKTQWKRPADVMVFDLMPVRSPAWLYGGRALKEPKYLELWKRLNGNPQDEEVLRNLPMRQPVLWEEGATGAVAK